MNTKTETNTSWKIRYKKVCQGVTTVGISLCLAGIASACSSSAEENKAIEPNANNAAEQHNHGHAHHNHAAVPCGEVHVNKAVCVLFPTKGHEVHGIITFLETPEGTKIDAEVFNLTPGKHGFHVHEFGDLSAEDGMATGGHFNPDHMDHSGPDSEHRHAGDLGNLDADATGYAHYTRIDKELQLNGGETVVGRSIIVHVGEDDLKSQPTGNAGARVAQGVIGIAK